MPSARKGTPSYSDLTREVQRLDKYVSELETEVAFKRELLNLQALKLEDAQEEIDRLRMAVDDKHVQALSEDFEKLAVNSRGGCRVCGFPVVGDDHAVSCWANKFRKHLNVRLKLAEEVAREH